MSSLSLEAGKAFLEEYGELDMSYQITFKNKSYLNLNFIYTFQYEKNVGVGNNMFTKAFEQSSGISQDDMILELKVQ